MINDSKETSVRLDIVSTEAILFSGDVRFILATGDLGELGIAPGHTPLITTIKPGLISVTHTDKTEEIFYVSGGMLEIQPTIVTVLANTVIRANELDEAAAKEERRKAQEFFTEQQAKLNYTQALARLAEATAKLQAIRQLRKIRKYRGR